LGVQSSFDELIAEAEAAPINGWDFGWLDGRATEERPTWRYSQLVAERVKKASRMLDLQSGGGEMLGSLPNLPSFFVATEDWAPNLRMAALRLRPRGASVVGVAHDQPALPFRDATFDLVTSRHPVFTWWNEVARVLRPGGRYLSQQVGPFSVREITEYLMGPLPSVSPRTPILARAGAEAAGLRVEDLREARLLTTFGDVGAVVYFLRLVIWIVPDFTVEKYRGRLRALHHEIQEKGPFVAYSTRFLIEATKPVPGRRDDPDGGASVPG
jgi:SAM-dependent methyltransferase